MGDELYNIPIGFRFEPSDEELIRGFLLPKVMGFPLPWNGIVEKELYGDNAAPWNVFSDIDDDNSSSLYCNTKKEGDATKKTVYVFTKKKRVSRSAGCGMWNGQTGPKNIKNSTTGDIIGFVKMLSFKLSTTDNADDSDLGHWIMHEYSLSGERSSDVVLCRITRCMKDSDRRRIPPPPVVEETHKRTAENQESGSKKHKCCVEGLNSEVVEEDCTLTEEDIERMLESSNHEVEGCTLTAEDIGRISMDSDDEKSNYEVEGCTVAEESAAALPPSSTTTGDGRVIAKMMTSN